MNKILSLIIIVSCFLSCRNNEIEGLSPSERNKQSIDQLRKELVDAPYGWKVIYFPKTDSLLFSDKDAVFSRNDALRFNAEYGYGGHYFMMKFQDNGIVNTLVDTNETTLTTQKKSEFEVRQNTYTQLSFTTFGYIHHLVNENFGGKSDFLYKGKDWDGNLVFKTNNSTEPAREYIVFEKVKNEADFQNHIQKSYDNRTFFESLATPHITIRRGSRIYFQSDVRSKADARKRYHLFRFNKTPDPNPNEAEPVENNVLGSGYVGTEQGISFRTGIRYSSSLIFYDFERQGDTFVCELVRAYDPIRKTYRIMSKHLAPANAEPTGYVAEIR